MATTETNVPLNKLEVAASLGAVRAIADAATEATGGTPLPLTTAAQKFDRALKELNEENNHA